MVGAAANLLCQFKEDAHKLRRDYFSGLSPTEPTHSSM
jgi:hypothetical protein